MSFKIAILKLGALGDVVRTTSILRPLHRYYPGAEIWWFTLPSARALLERNPWIFRLVAVEGDAPGDARGIAFDRIISLDEDLLAARWSSALAGRERFGTFLSPDEKVRYTPSSRLWFDMSLLNRDPDGTLGTANRLKQANQKTYPQILLEMLALEPASVSEGEPVIVADPAEERWAAQFRSSHGIPADHRLIGLNTGSGARWINKQMTVDKTLQTIRDLGTLKKTTLLLLGGPEEKERNADLVQKSPIRIVDGGTENSLVRFISLVNLCSDLVTSDSLALHIGLALGKRVFPFFGPTSAAEIDLYGRGAHWLPQTACRCFYLNRCREKNFCLDTLDAGWLVKHVAERVKSMGTQNA